MNNQFYLSQEKYEELTSELEDLKINRRREVAERLESAKSLGDLSENAEYHAAREEQSEIEDRIIELENILKSSEIVTPHHSSIIEVGSTLTVKRLDNGVSQKYSIVGSEESDWASGKISHLSPLGASLLGRKKGDEVMVTTPKGEIRYKVVSID